MNQTEAGRANLNPLLLIHQEKLIDIWVEQGRSNGEELGVGAKLLL
jgi:hypothetical protein